MLLAGLLAEGETSVVEPAPTRDHTERMLHAAGADVGTEEIDRRCSRRRRGGGSTVRPAPIASSRGRSRSPATSRRPPSRSSPRCWCAGSHMRVEAVGLNPTRIGLLGVLRRMGAAIEVTRRTALAEASPAARSSPATARSRGRGSARRRCRWRSTSSRSSPSWAALRTARPWSRAPRSCATRSRTGSPPWSRGCAGRVPRSRSATTASRCTVPDGLRGGALDARGDHRLAMLGRDRRARLARRRRGGRHGGGRRQLPRVRVGPRVTDPAVGSSAQAGNGGSRGVSARRSVLRELLV